jgi:membrane protease YdiL (CAAX protease family)
VHPAAAAQLERIYQQLNRVDPGSDGSLTENRWGGAGEIGGSPRKSGTRLTAQEIASACRDACTRWTPGARARRLLGTALGALALLALGSAPLVLPVADLAPAATLATLTLFSVVATTCLIAGRRAPGFYGLRLPRGLAAWAWLPVALAAGALGGVFVPSAALPTSLQPTDVLLGVALLAAPAGLELLFRGYVTARLLPAFSGRSLVWVPVLTALGYAALLACLPSAVASVGPPGTPLAAALAFGLASGAARERSESVALPVLFAWLGVAAQLARAALT